MGFIAMKALSGGLINNSRAAYVYLAQFDNVLPIWGVQRERELDEFLSYVGNPPEMTDEIRALIDKDRKRTPGRILQRLADTVCHVPWALKSTTVPGCPL